MAFDFGFNFRGTAGFVTDPSYAVPVLGEAYPETYTNDDGLSINAGWTPDGNINILNRSTGVDVRLAGINFQSAGVVTFRVDLSSGSAPGAGDYTVDMALGDQGGTHPEWTVTLKDDATTRITFAVIATAANKYFDATGVERSPGTSSWDLVRETETVTFASTTVNLETEAISENIVIAHFRLTLQEVAGGSRSGAQRYIRNYQRFRHHMWVIPAGIGSLNELFK